MFALMSFSALRRALAMAVAWSALLWETAVGVLWPAVVIPGLFAALALFGLWERLGDPARAAAYATAIIWAGVFIWRGARRARWPGRESALRRVEEDTGLHGRPFESLSDAPVTADPAGRALWRAHQARMRAALAGVRARRPKAALANADRFAVRGALVLLLGAGAIAAGPATMVRLGDAFGFAPLAPINANLRVEAWIDPPDYTGRAPIFLTTGPGVQEVSAPAGSTFVARLAGARRAPKLDVVGPRGRERTPFERVGPGAHEARAVLNQDADVRVPGAARAAWRVDVAPDEPPRIAILGDPEPGPRQELTFVYILEDDYGATDVTLQVRLAAPKDGESRESEDAAPYETALTLPPGGRAEAEKAEVDLTEHPWAGREVEVTLEAGDAVGGVGVSGLRRLVLPERVFVDPLARAVAEQRRTLVRSDAAYAADPGAGPANLTAADARKKPPFRMSDPDNLARAPDAVKEVERGLDLMSLAPEWFADDLSVQLALDYAVSRLKQARDRAGLDGLEDVLWDAALRAEGGEVADAERALRAAEKALADALARGDPAAEIERLTQAYQEAVDRYLDALRQQALEEGRVMDEFASGDSMSQDEIEQMLQALRDLAATGSRDEARRLLQALSEMLRNMQMTLAAGPGGNGEMEQDKELRESLEQLGDLIGRQRGLMDDTFNAERLPEGEARPTDDLAEDQGDLRETLEALRGALDEQSGAGGSEALEEAERAMEMAENALGEGDAETAGEAQSRALEGLREGAEALAREAIERARRRAGLAGQAEGEQSDSDGRDPFGRRSGGAGFDTGGDGDDVPSEMERRRAREILDELRRRAGERDRGQDELDYIKRLLDRF